MLEPTGIALIIQLAVAPVFLLAGIGGILNVITARLGRAVDRARYLETALATCEQEDATARIRTELRTLDKRMALCQSSIAFSTVSALLVCVVVVALFVGALAGINFNASIALIFIVALIVGLALFVAEISLATRMLRVRAELLMK